MDGNIAVSNYNGNTRLCLFVLCPAISIELVNNIRCTVYILFYVNNNTIIIWYQFCFRHSAEHGSTRSERESERRRRQGESAREYEHINKWKKK